MSHEFAEAFRNKGFRFFSFRFFIFSEDFDPMGIFLFINIIQIIHPIREVYI